MTDIEYAAIFQFFVPCAIAFIYVYGMVTFTWR